MNRLHYKKTLLGVSMVFTIIAVLIFGALKAQEEPQQIDPMQNIDMENQLLTLRVDADTWRTKANVLAKHLALLNNAFDMNQRQVIESNNNILTQTGYSRLARELPPLEEPPVSEEEQIPPMKSAVQDETAQ